LDALKKLEQWSQSAWSSGGICRINTFFQSCSLFSL
jgi:hypothetical protein